jgi:hypothetical protein
MTDREQPDELMLAELRRLAGEVDRVPSEVTSFAKAALGWRRIDADLAELLTDSVLDSDRLATARGPVRARSLAFRSNDLEVSVEIHDVDAGILLLGQLAPPSRATIDVERDDGTISKTFNADELGRFRVELAVTGRIRLRIKRDSHPAVETSWIST